MKMVLNKALMLMILLLLALPSFAVMMVPEIDPSSSAAPVSLVVIFLFLVADRFRRREVQI